VVDFLLVLIELAITVEGLEELSGYWSKSLIERGGSLSAQSSGEMGVAHQ